MKHPSSRLTKHRRIAFDTDFDIREDDLLLADVSVIRDDAEPAVTPLGTGFGDQDDIDRLLINTGFDTDMMQPNPHSDKFAIIGDIQLDANTPTFDTSEPLFIEPMAVDLPLSEAAADFQVDNAISAYLAMRPMHQIAEPEPESETESNDAPPPLKTEPASSETIALNTVEPNITEMSDGKESGSTIENQPETEHFISGITETTRWDDLAAEPENTGTQQAHPLPKSRINYIILAIACASLLATCLLGMMVYDMKNEVTKLSGLLAIVKEDIEIGSSSLDGGTSKLLDQ